MIFSCRARREKLKNKGEVKKEEPSPSFADAIAKEYERSVRQSPPFWTIFDMGHPFVTFIDSLFRLSKGGGGSSGGDEPTFAEAMAAEYRKYQQEHGITDDELEEFGEWVARGCAPSRHSWEKG